MRTTPERLSKAIDTNRAPLIVDTRSFIEFNQGHIPGAIFMPFYKALFMAASASPDKQKPVVIYCESGPRAMIAKLGFKLAGFQQVGLLKGHMHGWRNSGLPVE